MSTVEETANGAVATFGYARASRLFNAYRFVSRLGFHVPLVTLALIGQPLVMVGVLVASYGLASSFSGPLVQAIVGRLGLARTVALGEIGKAVGALGIGCLVAAPEISTHAFALIAAACQIVGGIGYTAAAIPDGMLAGRLRTLPDAPANTSEADARAASLMFAAFMVAGLAGAAIAQFNFPLPFFLGAAASFCGALVALRLVGLEAPRPAAGASVPRPTESVGYSAVARDATFVYGLYRGASLSIQVGIMPLLLFVDRQMPVWLIGVAFATYTFTGYLSAKKYGAISGKLGDRAQALAIAALSVISLAGLALIPGMWVAIAPVPLFFAAGLVRPYCLPRITADLSDPAARQARIARAEKWFALVSAGMTLAAFVLLAYGISLPVFFAVAACILGVSALVLAGRT